MKTIYDRDWHNESMFSIEKGYISDEGITCSEKQEPNY